MRVTLLARAAGLSLSQAAFAQNTANQMASKQHRRAGPERHASEIRLHRHPRCPDPVSSLLGR